MVFLGIKVVTPSPKSWLYSIKCHNTVRNSHYQPNSDQVKTTKGILSGVVKFQCKHRGSTCDTWLLYSARKHPSVFALLSLSFSSSVPLSIYQCQRVQTSQGPVVFFIIFVTPNVEFCMSNTPFCRHLETLLCYVRPFSEVITQLFLAIKYSSLEPSDMLERLVQDLKALSS